MEPPPGPEITALAAWGGEPLCDYILMGKVKKSSGIENASFHRPHLSHSHWEASR